MYVPPAFRVEDEAALRAFVARHGFATLVSVVDGVPFASHLPLMLSPDDRSLQGHMAWANPQWRSFTSAEVLAVFTGPHAYISPTWYETTPAVPTWNYTAVHVYGVPRVVEDEAWLRESMDRLIAKYDATWDGELPDDFRRKLLAGVVGFEVAVTRVEGKFKLGQNRPAEDRAAMARRLEEGDADERALAEFIRLLAGMRVAPGGDHPTTSSSLPAAPDKDT